MVQLIFLLVLELVSHIIQDKLYVGYRVLYPRMHWP